MSRVKIGLEKFIEYPPKYIEGKRLGLLCNPASVLYNFLHASELINKRFPGQLKALFSPQHGYFAEKQDNMIESCDFLEPALKIPIFSLYAETRIPTERMFDLIDILIVDIQDVGTRVYTFIYTVSYCMEAAKRFGKSILILDRPNPINGIDVEGNCLSLEFASFVGRYPIPMRHGLTIGELAVLFNEHFGIGCDLKVIPMKNWNRSMYFKNTGLPWLAPSPNMPTPMSAIIYPGQVLWEGTNVSEGRGTTLPFEFFGAPYFDVEKILSTFGGNKFQGVWLRNIVFEPTSNKWAGNLCKGFQIHVIDLNAYKPYITTLRLLQSILIHNKNQFAWKNPPYEYEFEKLPIDLIIGDQKIRKQIENLDDLEKIELEWQEELEKFKQLRTNYFIYK